MKHIFIIGAKGFTYGGYETFLDKLTSIHSKNNDIKYHIACKANGAGITDENELSSIIRINNNEYEYHNAHCFKIKAMDLGSAQAIIYDIKAMNYCLNYIKKNSISNFIIYVLSSRIGPCMHYYSRIIHKLGGQYFNNPDGREALRRKYGYLTRKYWDYSEKGMVKFSDLVVCDSINIEKYIQQRYEKYNPKTTYIAYGSEIVKSSLSDDSEMFTSWLRKYNLSTNNYYLSVGRFVPENNFETMIKEFMNSTTKKDFAIITTKNERFLKELDDKLHFSNDSRIKFVGTVYNQELLKKIRENAFAYFHGHEVGGTNPSLLEALGATSLNLLLDVGFNREVAEEAALYWNKDKGNLASLINHCDKLDNIAINDFGVKAKNRIVKNYSWELISQAYYCIFS